MQVRCTVNLHIKNLKMHPRPLSTPLPWLHRLCPQSLAETSNCQKYPVITSSCCPVRTRCILGTTLRLFSLSLPHLLAGEAGQALA